MSLLSEPALIFPPFYRVQVVVFIIPNAFSSLRNAFFLFKECQEQKCKLLNKYVASTPRSLSFTLALRSFSLLFAREDLWLLAAGVALDHAAPVELAVALPDARVVVRVVAAAAAHHATAVAACRCAIAQAAPCAHAPRGCVLFTVVGWALQVHQVSVGGFLEAPSLLDPQERGLTEAWGTHWLHLNSVGVALLEEVANLSEFGQGDPAGFGGAGAGDTVAFTLQLHTFLQDLMVWRSRSTLILSFSKIYRYL